MSSSRKSLLVAAALAVAGLMIGAGARAGEPARHAAHPPGYFGYGTTPTAAEIAGWDIDVRGDDGKGLPPGKGTVDQGADLFAQNCAACHGTFGEGEGRYPKLTGGEGTLTAERPEPSVGSYWPFAPTLWDYINRAMPFPAPHSLSADDVYAITAYVLNLNNVVPSTFVADRDTLPKVKMPNHDHFVWQDPRPDTPSGTACMKACKDPKDVKVTSTAEGKDLTPRTTGPLDEMLPK